MKKFFNNINLYKYNHKFQTILKPYLNSRLRGFFDKRGNVLFRRGFFHRRLRKLKNLKWMLFRKVIGYGFWLRTWRHNIRPFQRFNEVINFKKLFRVGLNQVKLFSILYTKLNWMNIKKLYLDKFKASNSFRFLSFVKSMDLKLYFFLYKLKFFPTPSLSYNYIAKQGFILNGKKTFQPKIILKKGDTGILQKNAWFFFLENIFLRLHDYLHRFFLNDYRYKSKINKNFFSYTNLLVLSKYKFIRKKYNLLNTRNKNSILNISQKNLLINRQKRKSFKFKNFLKNKFNEIKINGWFYLKKKYRQRFIRKSVRKYINNGIKVKYLLYKKNMSSSFNLYKNFNSWDFKSFIITWFMLFSLFRKSNNNSLFFKSKFKKFFYKQRIKKIFNNLKFLIKLNKTDIFNKRVLTKLNQFKKYPFQKAFFYKGSIFSILKIKKYLKFLITDFVKFHLRLFSDKTNKSERFILKFQNKNKPGSIIDNFKYLRFNKFIFWLGLLYRRSFLDNYYNFDQKKNIFKENLLFFKNKKRFIWSNNLKSLNKKLVFKNNDNFYQIDTKNSINDKFFQVSLTNLKVFFYYIQLIFKYRRFFLFFDKFIKKNSLNLSNFYLKFLDYKFIKISLLIENLNKKLNIILNLLTNINLKNNTLFNFIFIKIFYDFKNVFNFLLNSNLKYDLIFLKNFIDYFNKNLFNYDLKKLSFVKKSISLYSNHYLTFNWINMKLLIFLKSFFFNNNEKILAFERLKLVNNNKFISKFLNFFLIYNSNYFLNVKKFDILQLSRYLISNRSILINKLNLRNNRNFYKSWRKKYLFWRSLILNSNSLNKNIKISKILLKNWAFFYNQEIRKFNNSFINFEDNKNTKSFILKHININLFKDSIFLYENKYNTINNALIYPFFIDFKDNKNLKLKHFIEGGVLKRKKYGISSQKKQFRRAIHLLRKMFKNKSLLAFKNKRILNKKFSLKNVMFQNFIWKPSYVELDYNTFRFIISDTNILSSPNFYNLSFKNYKFLLLYMSKRGY